MNSRETGEDMGKFKAPTLRNIAVTAPYLHDGSVATLEELIDLYASGGREISTGESAGMALSIPIRAPLLLVLRSLNRNVPTWSSSCGP